MGISTKARKKIESKKRFGVRQNITEYYKEIVDTFYNEKILEEKLNKYLKQTGQENLNDTFLQYLNEVNQNMKKLLEKAKDILIDSWKKGTERIQDQEGNTIKFDEEIDENAIKLLAKEQERNYKSLTKQQTQAVNNTISKGLEQGKSYEEIANDIKSRVKTITKNSAMRISRSEILSTHTKGQIQTMQKTGLKHYSIINSPDYIGKDGKQYPCIICRKLQGSKGRERIYDLDKAGGQHPIIPEFSHPNCNCVICIRTDKEKSNKKTQ